MESSGEAGQPPTVERAGEWSHPPTSGGEAVPEAEA
jgi:hypothetical protein